jgi:flagellar biogenesis protein FliO
VLKEYSMIKSIFGDEPSTIMTAVIAFIVVMGLIILTGWLVRRFGGARFGGTRGRQPRLAVIDAAAVDGRRKLIIIRRDNVEHLLMIGGPSDVVVETNIMRAPAAQREATPARVDTLPRAVPLPEPAAWAAQAEPAIAARAEPPRLVEEQKPAPLPPPVAAPVPPPIPVPLSLRPEPQLRPQPSADPLIGLAAELSRTKSDMPRAPEPPRLPLTASFGTEAAPAPAAAVAPPVQVPPPVPPVSMMPAAPPVAAPIPPISPSPVPNDAHLAEMAQRLETALRRPLAPLQNTRSEPKRAEPKPPGLGNGPTNGAQPGNGAPARSIYEDLEQEMASLLGRQPGKS